MVARSFSTYRGSRKKGEYFSAHPESYFEGLRKQQERNSLITNS
jgi:hypothetical protein